MQSSIGASLALGEFIFSPLLKMVGHARWQLLAACTLTGLFCALMAIVKQSTLGMAIAFACLTGLGVGWIEMVAITTATLVRLPRLSPPIR